VKQLLPGLRGFVDLARELAIGWAAMVGKIQRGKGSFSFLFFHSLLFFFLLGRGGEQPCSGEERRGEIWWG